MISCVPIHSCRECQQRLKACDDAFREQLEAKERGYDQNLKRVVAEKDKEIELASQKVSFVLLHLLLEHKLIAWP